MYFVRDTQWEYGTNDIGRHNIHCPSASEWDRLIRKVSPHAWKNFRLRFGVVSVDAKGVPTLKGEMKEGGIDSRWI